jgi:hypothetical protein
MGNAGADEVRLLAEPLGGGPELPARLGEVRAAAVAQLDVLEVPPDPLFGIQLRGVARELLEVDSRGCPVAQELPDEVPGVDRRAVPDDEQLARARGAAGGGGTRPRPPP